MLTSSGAATVKGISTPLAQCWINASRLPIRTRNTNPLHIRSHTLQRLQCRTETCIFQTRKLYQTSIHFAPETESAPNRPDPIEEHLNIHSWRRNTEDGNAEAVAKWARETFRDNVIPDGVLSPQEMKVYVRLYGEPVVATEGENIASSPVIGEEEEGTMVQQRADFGYWETVAKEIDELPETLEEGIIEDENLSLDMTEDLPKESIMDRSHSEQRISEDDPDEDEFVIRENRSWGTDASYIKTHPYTLATRFGTSPSTVFFPKATFIEPITQLLADKSKSNLRKAAESAFSGVGLPYSPSTAKISRSMEQRPIPLNPRQSRMRDQDADVYISTVMPQIYATILSILTEVRKRLGSEWLRDLFGQGKAPFILDAGSGGAGVLAWQDILRAEFGNETVQMGKATVVVGSDTLRRRAAKLLDNTTFIPRLPDKVPAEQPINHPLRKQYDVIIASHQIWSIKADTERKNMVETLWSLLNPKGGVLILLEKGIPRGFEALAGAREHIRTRLMINPDDASLETDTNSKGLDAETSESNSKRFERKSRNDYARPPPTDAGMIIAPCTNHLACPMYKVPGLSRGRKDWCYFSQRYVRPPFLQSILGASKRNHDDVEFSYLAVRRGIDLRNQTAQETGQRIVQNETATEKALHGYADEHKTMREDYIRLRLERELKLLKEELPTGKPAQVAVHSDDLPQEEEVFSEQEAASLDHQNEDDLNDEQKAIIVEELETWLQKTAKTKSELADVGHHSATESGNWNDSITPFMLPRTIMPPIKRKGHVLFDVCTPAGTIERWFVSKKSGKTAYRDARHSQWGDLWALGAYSRTPRNPRVGKVGGSDLSSNSKRRMMAAKKDLGYDLGGEDLWNRWSKMEADEEDWL